ncbi:GLUG motif-containing protein [Sedimentisphaera salicampi]|uniref:GLUG domain-containing protein n=1 Tax=Sedimentisphaera salicampi TaxID=1941349 RepID=A0A1W6LMW6_9BACT|nr:GLUG motif-containing protein [Sedimentisphaera salicampi]ARN57119.1 hypothetical protein STSP1_01514 [Sedimentisphaera salicampi]
MNTLRLPILAAIFTASIAFGFAAGDGTENNPYQISTPDHLEAVNNDLSAHYVLTNNIDLSDRTYERAVIAPDTSYISWGFNGTPFSGSFDGAGYKILNLTVDTLDVTENHPRYLGLFGKIKGGEIQNLGIENAGIIGCNDSWYLGGLCGYNSKGLIKKCYTKGSVSGGGGLGGLCGVNAEGTILNCYAEGSVSGYIYIGSKGGLCGYNEEGTITNCYATGDVSGDSNLGGLCGDNYGGTITNCYAAGSVSGGNDSWCFGGLCGDNSSGTITKCYAEGDVSGGDNSDYLGGLCGMIEGGKITNCYATGSVSGGKDSEDIGGLCGYNDLGTIQNCYSKGEMTAGDKSKKLGGLCGENEGGTITNCFWDKEGSGIAISEGGRPKTTAQMKSAATFFGWNDGSWTINEGNDHPCLAWENAEGSVVSTSYQARTYSGEGTQENPFEISDAKDLVCLSNRPPDWDKHFVLINDIDMEGEIYYPITTFSGSFDGSSFKIFNLEINSEYIGLRSQLGLFGKINEGEVSNIGIENAQITGGEDSLYFGGLCGYNRNATIENCYTTGSVSGGNNSRLISGLCGENAEGKIIKCYSKSYVSGGNNSEDLGGLCGDSSGTITKCYARGHVSGGDDSRHLGGLTGLNSEGKIKNCYSTCDVKGGDVAGKLGGLCGINSGGTITNCYSTGFVSGGGELGGLCGWNGGTIKNCYAEGDVSGVAVIGALCGFNTDTITNCYAAGDVSGGDDAKSIGGLCGINFEGRITKCYSKGYVTAGGKAENFGGFCGNNSGVIINSFWDKETSGIDTSDGGAGLYTNQMKTLSTFTNAGWDFADSSAANEEDGIWLMDEKNYPKLNVIIEIGLKD